MIGAKTKFFSVAAVALTFTVMTVPMSALGASSSGHWPLESKLRLLVQRSKISSGEVGIWVGRSQTSVASGSVAGSNELQTLFSLNGDRQMIPASLSKLVTLGAALHQLQPTFKFKTLLMSDAKITNGHLRGSLFLKGGGDPSFVSEDMWFLVNELRRTGITDIDGDIVVDDSRFDRIRFGDDRQDQRVDRAYDAPVGAMSFNWNSVNVFVRPGEKTGDSARVFVDVASPYIRLKSDARTVAAGKGKTISIERTTDADFVGDVITVHGAIALDQPEVAVYKNITQPDLWAGYGLVEFLRQRAIQAHGSVKVGVTPKNPTVLATQESKPLSAIVADMAKWSNNFVAETLVKNLAAESGEQPATMATGLAQVRQYFESLGNRASDYKFINAAGFTRKNRLSAQHIGRFLEKVRTDFTFFPEYFAALPIAGVDGTLRKRMKATPAERWVRAKTGLLNGVVGLAGFAGHDDGTILSFALIYNGSGREDKARALFDQIAALLSGGATISSAAKGSSGAKAATAAAPEEAEPRAGSLDDPGASDSAAPSDD